MLVFFAFKLSVTIKTARRDFTESQSLTQKLVMGAEKNSLSRERQQAHPADCEAALRSDGPEGYVRCKPLRFPIPNKNVMRL